LPKKEYFTTAPYDDIIKLFIIQNPMVAISSGDKIDDVMDTLELFVDCKNNHYKNTYTIRYEDMTHSHGLLHIMEDIGLIWKDTLEALDHPDLSNLDVTIRDKERLHCKAVESVYPEIKYYLCDDIVIPFGEECYTAQSIDAKFSSSKIRKCSLPFDYVGHTYVESIYENMMDLLDLNINHCKRNQFEFKLFGDTYFMCHTIYGYKYWHDIHTDNTTNNVEHEIDTFVEKYERRYERLKYYLKKGNHVKILSVNHFDNIYNGIVKQEAICKLFHLLKSHNDTITFIAINFGEDVYNVKNLQFVNLPVNLHVSFVESKQEFTKTLQNFIKSAFH